MATPSQLIGQTISHYRVVEKLDTGIKAAALISAIRADLRHVPVITRPCIVSEKVASRRT